MKLVRLTLIAIAFPLLAQAQTSFCRKESLPDVIHVTLVDCGDPKSLFLRVDGDDRNLLPFTPTSTPNVWQHSPLPGSVESNVLCPKICGYASVCVSGAPRPDKDANGKKICIAEYEFRCQNNAWTLAVESKPPITIDWTRKRSGVEQQRGVLLNTPGSLCDLAPDEEINIKPQLRDTKLQFLDIPIKQDDLKQERTKSRTYGASQLVGFVVRPEGKRTEPPSDNEKAFLKTALKELTLKIEPGSK